MPRIRLYPAHSGQARIHLSPARFRVATCGRRFGKTYACVNELVKHAWENKTRGGDALGWWVAPVYRQSLIGFRLIAKKFATALKPGGLSLSELRMVLRSGGVIEARSADNPDSMRGEGVTFAVLDEASRIQQRAWEEVIRPTLTDRLGKALLVSTPKGRNYFFHLWMRGQDPLHPDWASWSRPSHSNPFLPRADLDEAAATLPEDVYRQEYLAEFLEDSAGVFRNIRGCIGGALLPQGLDGESYVLGWDPARAADGSVLVVMHAPTRQVVYFDRIMRLDYRLQIERVVATARLFNNARILMDSTPGSVGDPLLSRLQEIGMNVEGFPFTNTSKQQLVQNLAIEMQHGRVHYPNIPILIAELEMFEYTMMPSGRVKYAAPEGFHDDCVCALALATWEATHGGGVLDWYRQQSAELLSKDAERKAEQEKRTNVWFPDKE